MENHFRNKSIQSIQSIQSIHTNNIKEKNFQIYIAIERAQKAEQLRQAQLSLEETKLEAKRYIGYNVLLNRHKQSFDNGKITKHQYLNKIDALDIRVQKAMKY